jgi:hypothetical protein
MVLFLITFVFYSGNVLKVSAWKQGGGDEQEQMGEREGKEGRGGNDPIIVCTYE